MAAAAKSRSRLAASATEEAASTESSEAAVVKEELWPACHERQSVGVGGESIKHLCDDEPGWILLALK